MFTNNASEVSNDLRELLSEKNSNVEIVIRDNKDSKGVPTDNPNGRIMFKKGKEAEKNEIVIVLDKELFEKPTDDMLKEVLAHEMAHLLELDVRLKDSEKHVKKNEQGEAYIENTNGAETYADMVGGTILKNAGIEINKEFSWSKHMGEYKPDKKFEGTPAGVVRAKNWDLAYGAYPPDFKVPRSNDKENIAEIATTLASARSR
jgi:hypothetical protein